VGVFLRPNLRHRKPDPHLRQHAGRSPFSPRRDEGEAGRRGPRGGVGPTDHFDGLVPDGAGGKFSITGDYLYRDYPGPRLDAGIWGLLRIIPKASRPPWVGVPFASRAAT
jgi:hypothetical protein